MPNLTTPIPPRLTGRTETDIAALRKWGTALIDELSYLFQNLDAGNVSEAASVKAEHIDTNTAKISNAQIGALTASKLTAGTIDTDRVTVASPDGSLEMSGSEIVISDTQRNRFRAAYDRASDTFSFALYNQDGAPTVYINSYGDAVFSGRVEGSEIYASTIVGTDSASYASTDGGVFAEIDQTGIKIQQDQGGIRKQKVGITVSQGGVAYLVLGAGNGEGSVTINGVTYTKGSFKIEKFENGVSIGLVGGQSFLNQWENGQTDLTGAPVLINGRDVLAELDALKA